MSLFNISIAQHVSAYLAIIRCSNPLRTESESESESELLYDWRFTANQFVLAPSPLTLTTRVFLTEPLWSESLCNNLSDESMGLCLIDMLVLLSNVWSHMTCYWKFLLLHYIQILCQSRFCKADHACLTYLTKHSFPQLLHCYVRVLGWPRDRYWVIA
jgi:hypothetical protein